MQELLWIVGIVAVLFFVWNIFSERERIGSSFGITVKVVGAFLLFYIIWNLFWRATFELSDTLGPFVAIVLIGAGLSLLWKKLTR